MLASLDNVFIHRLNTNIDKDTCELALGIIRGVCALPAQAAVQLIESLNSVFVVLVLFGKFLMNLSNK